MGPIDAYMVGSGLELQGLKNAFQAQQIRDEMGLRNALQSHLAQQKTGEMQRSALSGDLNRMTGGGISPDELKAALGNATQPQLPEKAELDYWKTRDPQRAMEVHDRILKRAQIQMALGGDPEQAFNYYNQATGDNLKYAGTKGEYHYYGDASGGWYRILNKPGAEPELMTAGPGQKPIALSDNQRLVDPTTGATIGGTAPAVNSGSEFQRAIAGLLGKSQAPDTMQRSQQNFGYAPFPEVEGDIRMAGADYGAKGEDINKAVDDARNSYKETRFPVSGKVGRTSWSGTQSLLGDVNKDAGSTAPVVKVGLEGDGTDGLGPEDITHYAQMYNKTGQLPSLGMGKSKLRSAILKEASRLARGEGKSGTDVVGDIADTKGLQESIKVQEKSFGAMGSFVKNIDKQVARVGQLANELKTFDTRLLNVPLRAIRGRIAGSPNQAKYDMYLTEIESEIGKLATGSSGSVAELSQSAQEKWARIHDKNLSINDMLSLLKETSHAGKLRYDSAKEQLDETRSRLRGGNKPTGADVGRVKPAVQYFRQHAGKYSQGQLLQALKSQGWSDDDIATAWRAYRGR